MEGVPMGNDVLMGAMALQCTSCVNFRCQMYFFPTLC